MKRAFVLVLAALVITTSRWAMAQPTLVDETSPPVLALFPAHGDGVWTGIGGKGELASAGEAALRFPDGPRGWHTHGLRRENDSTRDWRPYAGLVLDIERPNDVPVSLSATIRLPPQLARLDYVQDSTATTVVRGAGPHRIVLPWSAFDFQQAQPAFLKFVKELKVAVKPTGGAEGSAGTIIVKNVRLVRAPAVAVDAAVRGKAAERGSTVTYTARVANCTDTLQAVTVAFERYGWEAMQATVEPATLDLAPGEQKAVTVRVKVVEKIPPGGHERQVLKAVANGDASASSSVTFVTASALPHPNILHTSERWQAVRDTVKARAWAKEAQDEYLSVADKWDVPEVAKPPKNLTGVDTLGPFLFATTQENNLMAAGVAYQLTNDKKYAEKVLTFLRRLSDPKDGYPVTLRACNQSLVQEGHFFQHVAMAYDMIAPSGLMTDADRAQIERTFRLFMETMDFEGRYGAINNWNLSMTCGALYCALALQDLATADRFFSGPSGIIDQLGKGVLDDGWWYECAIGYNVWCASEFTQVALAMEPWGVNFRDMRVPVGYVPNFSILPWATSNQYGMSFEKWGPITHNYVDIKRMWDALPRFADYRGVLFGLNDATEMRLGGRRTEIGGYPLELAYYVYGDPASAALIKQSGVGKRDLLYGVPDLPEQVPELFRDSAYADNVGVAVLRSKTENRPIREQMQAVLHYGTHGGYHGHFDRTSLLHLSRYGRSFYNPEMVWYDYASYMYKFYVQNSTSKNMVVVDRKMQEPVESQRLLWYAGKMMQATVVQSNARWLTPPYGGMVYTDQPYKSLHEKAFAEGRYLPVPEKMPAYGAVTDYTEPVLQRRLMVVTDDYIVLADYLKGEREHTFESLLQMKGFKGIEAADKKLVRHDAQWDTNPLLDAQFTTDCDWFAATAPAKASFEMRWGPGADNEGTRTQQSEDGVLKLDVHTLWPAKQELMVGAVPEDHAVQKRLFWSVRGDGRSLAEGKFGAWILGKDDIDVPLDGVKQLELETRVEVLKKPTVFWGDARVVTADGKEIPLSELPVKLENLLEPKEAGKDYFGGPIKIVGNFFQRATPGQPQDEARPAVVRVDLSQLKAVRFKATLGGDYPLGDESQRRKTYAVHSRGREARFITVIEPYEKEPVVKRAVATGPDQLRVELADGRVQVIAIRNLVGDGKDIDVTIAETRADKVVRSESSAAEPSK